MSSEKQPLISVLTPVYNGEAFLAQCIESILRQSYKNYEYLIVNNCSTDRTLEIAQAYAKKDSRIKIHTNAEFVDVIKNHNIAFGLIPETAKYCKVVSADDFIFPDCLMRMVHCAEANPSVGVVGSYQISGDRIRWQGFEYPRDIFSGSEICRRIFLGGDKTFGFGSPTSLMYRADIVRNSEAFYPNPSPHSDTSACFRDLQKCDFGFVYEVLSYEKTHPETQSSKSADLNRYSSAYLNDLIQYGPAYLSNQELQKVLSLHFRDYRRFLAVSLFTGARGNDFWTYHQKRLAELGRPLNRATLIGPAIRTIIRELLNPEQAIRKICRRFFSKKTKQAHSELTKASSGPRSFNASRA